MGKPGGGTKETFSGKDRYSSRQNSFSPDEDAANKDTIVTQGGRLTIAT